MVAADFIPDDLQERTVRDMIGRACADALYEIRHKPDVETVRALMRENERKMRADKEFNVLNVMRLALTNKMYMVYMNTLNVDTGVHLYRDDYESNSDEYDTDGGGYVGY